MTFPHQPRRERLIAFIDPWAADSHWSRQYRPHVGDYGLGYRLPLDALTDRALEFLADQIVRDFWSRKHLNRRNRALRRVS